eukprot:33543_3
MSVSKRFMLRASCVKLDPRLVTMSASVSPGTVYTLPILIRVPVSPERAHAPLRHFQVRPWDSCSKTGFWICGLMANKACHAMSLRIATSCSVSSAKRISSQKSTRTTTWVSTNSPSPRSSICKWSPASRGVHSNVTPLNSSVIRNVGCEKDPRAERLPDGNRTSVYTP